MIIKQIGVNSYRKSFTFVTVSYTHLDVYKRQAQCLGCLRCIATCKAKALQVEGVCRDADEVVATCLQDRDFYEESQGGVTLSGGEALAQPSFAKALVLRLKQEGIHVAVETTGYIQPAVFQKLAPLFDLLLFDIKHYDTCLLYTSRCV